MSSIPLANVVISVPLFVIQIFNWLEHHIRGLTRHRHVVPTTHFHLLPFLHSFCIYDIESISC